MPDPFWRDSLWWPLAGAGSLLAVLLGIGTSPAVSPGGLLLVIVVYPILEEIVFRGQVQPLIGRHWPARWGQLSLANLATSAIFALAHVATRGPGLLTAGVFIPSLLFGRLAESRKGRLEGPIALHSLYNAGYFLPGLAVGAAS